MSGQGLIPLRLVWQRAVRWLLVFVLASVGAAAVAADGVAQLRRFVTATRSAEGDFSQVVMAKSGRKPQQATGSFAFLRPGKFRWQYDTPYQQLLVGDGERLWVWDRDLNQVTVKRMGDALGATPAAILFGSGDLERHFDLTDGGASDGLAWVEARSKAADTGFEALRLGMAGDAIRRMEMRDNFGQTTVIEFSRFVANPPLDAGRFRFTPPVGADVIGDEVDRTGR